MKLMTGTGAEEIALLLYYLFTAASG